MNPTRAFLAAALIAAAALAAAPGAVAGGGIFAPAASAVQQLMDEAVRGGK